MKEQKKLWSRLSFIKSGLAGMAGIVILPKISGLGNNPVAAEVNLGFIGMGQQSMFLLNGFLQIPGVNVVAGCDVYGIKRKRFEILMLLLLQFPITHMRG